MALSPILPIAGVPDDLLRALNDRFRELSSSSSPVTSQGSVAGLFFLHAKRPDANGTTVGTFGTETDRTVVYQVQTVSSKQVWVYASGTMSAAIASQPADLGSNDTGFSFLATDTYQLYRWSGSAWVNVTPANEVQIAYASGSLTLAVAHADVTGATLTLNRAGRYLIIGVFYFVDQHTVGTTDVGQNFVGLLSADGVEQTAAASVTSTVFNTASTNGQQWTYTPAAAGKIVKLRGYKSGGNGTSIISATHTSISAVWLGP